MRYKKAKQIENQLEQTKKESLRFLEKLEKFKAQNKENINKFNVAKKSDKEINFWEIIYPNRTELTRACIDVRHEIMNLSKELK